MKLIYTLLKPPHSLFVWLKESFGGSSKWAHAIFCILWILSASAFAELAGWDAYDYSNNADQAKLTITAIVWFLLAIYYVAGYYIHENNKYTKR